MPHNPTRFTVVVADSLCIPYSASAALSQRYFNQLNTTSGLAEVADVNSEGVVGVLLDDVVGINQDAFETTEGKSSIILDCTLDEQDLVKVGSGGTATKWTDSQTVNQTTITGEATAVTQPATLSIMTVAQAADVAADRGRVVRVVGAGATGLGIYEDITLNATASDTDVDGAVQFTTVCGAYMLDGAVLGAQSVTITDDDSALLMTIANATSELAADIPAQSREGYANILDLLGPNGDATFVSVGGYKCATPTTFTVERLTLDAASPSADSTAAEYRYIDRIFLGEFTNGGSGSLKTDATVDTSERIQGRCITPGVYLGTGAIQVLG